MPAVNAVLINMIPDPVLGLHRFTHSGMNSLLDGLRDFPVLVFSFQPSGRPPS
jgi:hypothetical protein